ncbi:rhamnulokinase [Pseudovibrio sp. Tun.PSC04-5.I4]|uniref:rhamnulokinase n=1 Tax=Pseudovibrio sp. Tun.PSC04-5.I4 TaxID=1798213 RepID=UPI000883FCBA|nr:rhamnulokinase [Pseudovibrio sp. Tun.PSC04-5.I4]SDQ13008.1 L-rhamnulokinase [Pseudovibrio sp. Tun.PSC04-5.I4]
MLKQLVTVDLGASSGRVILGSFDGEHISLKEWHRFDGYHLVSGDRCEWDIDRIHQEICHGIDLILDSGITPDGIGIDTWGVDFVLTDALGNRLGKAVSYRDARSAGVMEEVVADLGEEFIYAATGIQFLPFNTIYQLKALLNSKPAWLGDVSNLQFIPDYLGYLLTGETNCEYTFASTSQLLNCKTKMWDANLIEALGIPRHWFLPVSQPNHVIGNYEVRGHSIPVISIASHDTAAAVAAVAMSEPDSAFISSGTWSLIGIEEPEALTSDAARLLNVANEGGVEKFRVLKNVSGLWFAQMLREELGIASFAELVKLAEAAPVFRCFIDTNEPRFLNPASMIDEIKAYCVETNQDVPQTAGALARTIFESLAVLYRSVLNDMADLRGHPIPAIHVVGGGSQNLFLNQLCADACEIPVIAGPAEASATGNLMCQLIALGAVKDLPAGRQLISQSFSSTHFSPQSNNCFDAFAVRANDIQKISKDLGRYL